MPNAYTLMVLVGYFASALCFWGLARGQSRPRSQIVALLTIALLSSLLGAKIGHTLFEARGHQLEDGRVATSAYELLQSDPWHWVRLFDPGHVLLAALLFCGLAVFLYLKLARIERPLDVANAFAISAALGIGFGRIGCYFTGCCFGDTMLPLQLVESLFCFLCFGWLLRHQSLAFISFVGAYAIFRFVIEFWRADADRGFWWGGHVSTSQMICVGLFVGLCLVLFRRSDRQSWPKLG